MKKDVPLSIMSFLTILFLISCQKDNSVVVAKSKTELISKNTWKFSKATVGGSDVTAALQACQKDNVLTFVSTGSGSADEGAMKCNSSDPQTNPFTWNFQSNETVLFVSTPLFSGGSSTFTLVSLDDLQLVVSQMIIVGSSPQNAELTFVH